MKVLVTGATGYIGSHMVKRLAEHGYKVDAVDNNWCQNDIKPYIDRHFYWNICIPKNTIFDMGSKYYDAVIHLAAKTKVSLSVKDPVSYYETNILGTHHVIKAYNADNFIYASTGAAYKPETSPYAMSKRAGEDLVSLLPKHTICRFYNVSGNDGFLKYDDGYYHIMRTCAAAANGLLDSVTINGTDYDTKDGTTIRNYTHVSDIVDSLMRIVKHGPTNQIECLGNNTGHSVLDIINTMKKVSNVDFKVLTGPRREGDSVISILPKQSQFFVESKTLEDQCISALQVEK